MKVLVGEQQKVTWEGIRGTGQDQGWKSGFYSEQTDKKPMERQDVNFIHLAAEREMEPCRGQQWKRQAGTATQGLLACHGEASHGRGAQLPPSGTSGIGRP